MEKLSQVIETSDFLSLVSEWKQKSHKAAMLKLEAKRDFCNAYPASEGKNETARTSDAELKSFDAALMAECARIEAKAAEFLVQYALGNSPVH
jgi:hypothetical protein